MEQLIKGKHNLECIERTQNLKPVRAPVTLNSMKLLKVEIKNWECSMANKAMVWAVCTIAFAGCLRIHEILCREKSSFDQEFTLLEADMKLNKISHQGSYIKNNPAET